MTAPLGGFVMKDSLVTFGVAPAEYTNQINTCKFTPDQDTQTYKTLVPDGVVQDVDTATWTVELTGLQDHVAAQGLARYLFDNNGLTVPVTFAPRAGGVSWDVDVVCKATEIGGEQGDWATMEVELPIIGQPVPTDPL